MKKTLLILCIAVLFSNLTKAQEKFSRDLIYGDIGFGFENNYGNTGLLLGLGFQRNLSPKTMCQIDLHYFSNQLLTNHWQDSKDVDENTFYQATFLSATLGYALIGTTDKFNLTVKGGFSLGHLNKSEVNLLNYSVHSGTNVQIGLSVRDYGENKYVGTYNFGLDANFPIRKKQVLTLGFSTYSSDIPLQFLFCPIPVISYKRKL